MRTPSWEITDTPGYSAWAVGGAVAPALAQLDARIEQECGQARARFAEICRRKGVALSSSGERRDLITASWRDVDDEPEPSPITRIMRIWSSSDGRDTAMGSRDHRLTQCSRKSGRPLLIAGSITRSSISGTVFVCWKETSESARALSAALPLLKAAQRVVIAHVSEELDPTPLNGVVRYLERHGISRRNQIAAAARLGRGHFGGGGRRAPSRSDRARRLWAQQSAGTGVRWLHQRLPRRRARAGPHDAIAGAHLPLLRHFFQHIEQHDDGRDRTFGSIHSDRTCRGASSRPPAISPEGQSEPMELPSFEALNQLTRAMTARVTQGISPHAQIAAWTDWISHLCRAPGRQLELALRVWVSAARLARFAWQP